MLIQLDCATSGSGEAAGGGHDPGTNTPVSGHLQGAAEAAAAAASSCVKLMLLSVCEGVTLPRQLQLSADDTSSGGIPTPPSPPCRHTMGGVAAACLRLMDAARGRMLLENDISMALRRNADLDVLLAATSSNSALLVSGARRGAGGVCSTTRPGRGFACCISAAYVCNTQATVDGCMPRPRYGPVVKC